LKVSNFEQPTIRLAVIGGGQKKVPPMIDQWNEELHCPQCRQTGLASLSQPIDAEMPIVDRIPDGFKAVQTEYGPDFHCGPCNVRVVP
jgi:hypothetical protein